MNKFGKTLKKFNSQLTDKLKNNFGRKKLRKVLNYYRVIY